MVSLRKSGLPTYLWVLAWAEPRVWPPAQQGAPVGISCSHEAASIVCCVFRSKALSSSAFGCMMLSNWARPLLCTPTAPTVGVPGKSAWEHQIVPLEFGHHLSTPYP